jgi:hypothetical protein
MTFGKVSDITFEGAAARSVEAVPVLPKGETGIVLSLPFELHHQYRPAAAPIRSLSGLFSGLPPWQPLERETWGSLRDRKLDHVSFMYGMTYFDRVVLALPAHPVFGTDIGERSDLQKNLEALDGFHVMPLFPEGRVDLISDMSDGSVMFDPTATRAFQDGCLKAFTDLLERDSGGWEVGNGAYGLTETRLSKAEGGIVVRIVNQLPVVTQVDDAEDFLYWKTDQRPARVALRAALDDFVGRLGTATHEELETKAREIGKICHELVALSEERFPGVRLQPIKLHYNWPNITKVNQFGLLGGGLGSMFGIKEVGYAAGAAIGAAITGIRVEGGPMMNSRFIASSPFASVVDLQYKRRNAR